MNHRRFYSLLTILASGVALVLAALDCLPLFFDNRVLTWGSLAFFVLLCIAQYHLGEKSLKKANKNIFLRFFMGSVFIKMALCVAIILVYRGWAKPSGSLFVAPFFIIYLIFTAFEVYSLNSLSKKYS